MRLRMMTVGGWLAAVLVFGTGASVEGPAIKEVPSNRLDGIRQAREWQYAGDIAMAQKQPLVAHLFYEKVVKAFPGTPHGRLAEQRLQEIRETLREPETSPAQEPPGTWKKELKGFLTWP